MPPSGPYSTSHWLHQCHAINDSSAADPYTPAAAHATKQQQDISLLELVFQC
jgi:hypothetical protein